jgi:hypothetical protein
MKGVRKRKRTLADAAKEAALMFACDPIGLFSVFLVFVKSWKAGLIILAIILGVGVFGALILWENSRDT